MEKMTIRFWDKTKEEYADRAWLVIDDSGDIFDMHREGMDLNVSLIDVYEPHFYINGERVA